MRLILASASLRRAELLTAAGFTFEVAPANVDETPWPGEAPQIYALRVARDKAAAGAAAWHESGSIVIAADTVVAAAGRLLGKPKNTDEAERMLRLLSGAVHDVHTAVVIRSTAGERSAIDTTRVWFLPLTEAEIAWYLSSGEPEGKAGSYGIQGRAARFVDRIEGSWSNVVGLPISTVYRLLRETGDAD
jgi:septum formation protein